MADATGRAFALVSRTDTATPTQAQFGSHVQAVLQQHGDIASEACWQAMAHLVAEHWLHLANDQRPLDSWGMLSRCTETILKIRRGQKQGQRDGEAEALEEFRQFMGEVLDVDAGSQKSSGPSRPLDRSREPTDVRQPGGSHSAKKTNI